MDKPDFGIGKYYATRWTEERVAYLRHLADQGLSASQIAHDIFGNSTKAKRVAEACARNGVKLRGKPGRRPHIARPITIDIPEQFMPTLEKLGAKYNLSKAEIAFQLLAAIFDQGDAFLDNLLDLGGE